MIENKPSEAQIKYAKKLREDLGERGNEETLKILKSMGKELISDFKELDKEEISKVIKGLRTALGYKDEYQKEKSNLKDKFVRFSDLLKKATKKYPELSIKTEWLNRGEGEMAYKHPVFKAIVTTKNKTIEATGDIEISKDDTKFPIRKAESVTISRALRFLFGEDVTDIEIGKN